MKSADRIFHREWDSSRKGLYSTLEDCKKAGYYAIYLPELADRKIVSEKKDMSWQSGYQTLSLKVTASTRHRSRVMLIANCPHYFSEPENIQKSLDRLVDGAGHLPEAEVKRLIHLGDNGEKVIIIPYEKINRAVFGEQDLDLALENPLFLAAMNNDLSRAEKYLKKYLRFRGRKISILNFNDKEGLGRLLSLGYRSGELCGLADFGIGGRFYALPIVPDNNPR